LKQKSHSEILEEIYEGLETDLRETSEQIFNNMAVSSAVEEKKNVIVYLYNTERISLHFLALTAIKYLKDDFVFMSVYEPS